PTRRVRVDQLLAEALLLHPSQRQATASIMPPWKITFESFGPETVRILIFRSFANPAVVIASISAVFAFFATSFDLCGLGVVVHSRSSSIQGQGTQSTAANEDGTRIELRY